MTSAYYKGAKGALIIFDVSRRETFENVDRWYREIKNNADKNLAIVLVGNKSDLKNLRQVENSEAIDKAKNLSNN